MIGVVIGAAPSWREEWAALAKLGRPLMPNYRFAPVNAMLEHWEGVAHVFATLHPEKAAHYLGRSSRWPYTIAPAPAADWRPAWLEPERWGATSGLYSAQVLLDVIGCARVVLVGCPIEPEAGAAYAKPGFVWGDGDAIVSRYRQGVMRAQAEAGDRIRSMGGFTKNVFGAPDSAFLAV